MTIHRFYVAGSPVSVNRYGQPAYRVWRADVYSASMRGLTIYSPMVLSGCSLKIRYFRRLDRKKDIDNILKAILDGLDGRIGGGRKANARVLADDSLVEKVTSQRTDLAFHMILDGRALNSIEFGAAFRAQFEQATVYIGVGFAPNHRVGI